MRDKIYIVRNLKVLEEYAADELAVIDVGRTLAEEYQKEPEDFKKKSVSDSFNYFQSLFDVLLPAHCKCIVFNNIGILCEEDFSLNVSTFFLNYSKSYETYIVWPYHIVHNRKLVWKPDSPANFIYFNEGVLELKGDEDEVF